MQRESVLTWLREDHPERLDQLWRLADTTRHRFVGNEVDLWGTIKLSNCCDESCSFCGLRVANRDLARFALTPTRFWVRAQRVELGYNSVVLQAGRDPQLSADWLADTIRRSRPKRALSSRSVSANAPKPNCRPGARRAPTATSCAF